MNDQTFFPDRSGGWSGPPVQRPAGSWDPSGVAPVPSTRRVVAEDPVPEDEPSERVSLVESAKAKVTEILEPDDDETGERADLLRRVLARLIDGALVVFVGRFLATMFLTMLLGNIGYMVLVPFLMVLGVVYETVVTVTVGATVGKTVMGIEITSSDDTELGWQDLAQRSAVPTAGTVCFGAAVGMLNLPGTEPLSGLFPGASVMFGALGVAVVYLCVKQGWHDERFDTVVTRT